MSGSTVSAYRDLRARLDALRAELVEAEQHAAELVSAVRPELRGSARNLVHYLALRERDQRALQLDLATHGLSSLGRSESHVMAAIDAVRTLLDGLKDVREQARDEASAPVGLAAGQELLQTHTDSLLGPCPPERRVRIMVTLPSEAAEDEGLVHDLVLHGMDCARINAAHDDPRAWSAMAHHVRAAAHAAGRPCTIAVDLPGPKCRTGALAPGPEVLKLKPLRGPAGEVREPTRVWLSSRPTHRAPALSVRAEFIAGLTPGKKLSLRDARGRLRRFTVVSVDDGVAELAGKRTAYIASGTIIRSDDDEATIGRLPATESPLLLHVGDVLALTREAEPGGPAGEDPVRAPAHIPCEPPELVDMVRVGEAVWLDDGRVGGVVSAVEPDRFLVRITTARPRGEKLRAGKGINLPDSNLKLKALGEDDLEALAFAAREADVVSLSFAHDPEDVIALQQHVAALDRRDLGLILKIETRAGFARLPELLLAAMRGGSPGVMIARGDLAVECGFERLAEVQEEIMWICAAAHVPVVWATQVLESMAKDGRPTRAEVTDAAMAERAECVMLNKGPYIRDALRLLDDILRRMCAHQNKKVSMFRALRVAQSFIQLMTVPRPES